MAKFVTVGLVMPGVALAGNRLPTSSGVVVLGMARKRAKHVDSQILQGKICSITIRLRLQEIWLDDGFVTVQKERIVMPGVP